MSYPIALFRDDFTDGVIAPPWSGGYHSGSATIAETGGQFVATLPSSTAGTHTAGYQTPLAWDLTGDGCYINIGTMVSTAVAAAATFQVILDANNFVQWYQQSNTINVQKVVAGVATGLYSAAWSSTTYKYLRIRESGGTIFFDSSTNGTSWTNRASIVGLPFAISSIAINIGASCGNVASPGSFRVDDFNLVLPAPSSTWRWDDADWSITNRLKPMTLAGMTNAQCVIVTATTRDSAGVLGGTVRYFAGPLGSTGGGYLQLTEYASLVLAQGSAFQMPADGRVDLPALVDAQYTRLYHRSTDASAHTLYEFVPRRIVQADDIEAESIRAINIAAGAITADKIFVLTLAAITANIGGLNIDVGGYLWQGTGTAASPTTGLKIYNSGGIGKLSTYNTGVEQITLDTDGKLKAGAGNVQLSADGIYIIAGTSNVYDTQRSYGFIDTLGGARVADIYDLEGASAHSLNIKLFSKASRDSQMLIDTDAPTSQISFTRLTAKVNSVIGAQLDIVGGGANVGVNVVTGDFKVVTGILVGSGTGATAGDIVASGPASAFGGVRDGNVAVRIQGSNTTSSRYSLICYNSASTMELSIRNDGVGFLNAASWTYSSDANKKRNIRALGKDIVDFMKLEPKMFDYIDGLSNRWGYIAQDVQTIMPDLVELMPDGSLGLHTDELLPLFGHVLRRLIRILVQKNVIGPADLA